MLCSPLAALELKGHKDALFAWPAILEADPDGAFMVVDYNEMRDINGRDEEPERRVNSRYVSLGVRKASRVRVIEAGGRRIELGESGTPEAARFAVIFIHGRGGDQRLGMNDFSFGGNFNRLKNLAVLNGGVYVAPSIPSFDVDGARDVKAVIAAIAAQSPGAPVVLACGSMGAIICSLLARDTAVVQKLGGMVLLGGAPDPDLPLSAAVKARLPIVFTHGSSDLVYPWTAQKAIFDRIRATGSSYPARFILFQTGAHGTPIRMTDWKDVLQSVLGR